MMKEIYDTSKEVDNYTSLARDVLFTQMVEKREPNSF